VCHDITSAVLTGTQHGWIVVDMVSNACSDSTATAWNDDSVPSYTATFSQKQSATMKVVCFMLSTDSVRCINFRHHPFMCNILAGLTVSKIEAFCDILHRVVFVVF